MREHRYVPGKVDYNGDGRANCEAEITWAIEGVRFSMSAGIWRPGRQDYLTCGQAVDTVADYFPQDVKVQRMRAIWKRWHLNDMRVGSPAQEAWLRANPVTAVYPQSYFEVASAALVAAGLNPDPETGYRYGYAWNVEPLPAEVVAEIQNWG